MADWLTIRKGPIEAVEHGVDTADVHRAAATGPITTDALDYPFAHVLPQSTVRTDGTTWRHEIHVLLIYDRGRMDTRLGQSEYVSDTLHDIAAVIDAVLDALGDVPQATNYHPNRIEDFAGEYDNTALLGIQIEFQIQTAVNPGTFDA